MPLPTNVVDGQAGHAQLHNDVNEAVNTLVANGGTTGDVAIVKHRLDPSVARPVDAKVVRWIGSVPPVNATADDEWVDESAYWSVTKDAGQSWQPGDVQAAAPLDWTVGTSRQTAIKPAAVTFDDSGTHEVTLRFPNGRDDVTVLSFGDGAAGDVASFATMRNLAHLVLYGTAFTGDLRSLRSLTKLQELFTYGTDQLTGSLDGLSSMSNLARFGQTGQNFTGDLATIADLTHLSDLYIGNSLVTGDIAVLATQAFLYLHCEATRVTGDLGAFDANSTLLSFEVQNTRVTGKLGTANKPGLTSLHVENLAWTQAQVDAQIADLYTNRAAFTAGNPTLAIGGSNAAPSGTFQASANPTTGAEMLYALANDPNAEGFHKWAVTYTAP